MPVRLHPLPAIQNRRFSPGIERSRWVCTNLVLFLTLAPGRVWTAQEEPTVIPPAFAPVLAESREKVDLAGRRLAEIRTQREVLETEQARLEKEMRALDAVGTPAALLAREITLRGEGERLEQALAALSAGAFTSLVQMLEFDRLTDSLAANRKAGADVLREKRASLVDRMRAHPEGQAVAERWSAMEHRRIAAANEAVVRQEERDSVSRTQGSLQKKLAYPVEAPAAAARESLRLFPPPPLDQPQRLARFERRLLPEGQAETAQAFFSELDLQHPGLERVRALVGANQPAQALDAYREFFFARLVATPAENSGEAAGGDIEGVEGDVTDVNTAFSPPTAEAVEDAMAGILRATVTLPGKSLAVEANLGAPGAMHWGFLTPALAAEEPNGPLLLEFSRKLALSGTLGVALLHSYALGGPREHLDRWVAMLDDWTLNWRRDADASPLPLRDYNLLYVYRLKEALFLLRNVARMRPEFARDLPSATLARWLTAMNEEYLCSAIRLGRSGLYNFRIMALGGLIPMSLGLQEFRAHQWALREAWRQADDNFIYKTRRDGANFEFANDGHENTDQALINPFQRIRAWNPQPEWTEPFWAEEFMDNFLANSRYWVHNMKQDGFSYRLNARTQRTRYLGYNPEYKVNLLAGEDELRRRLWKVHGVGVPEAEPLVFSESLCHQGYSFLRSGWEPDDSFLYFQSIGQPILSGREDNTGFSLFGHGLPLLLTPAPAVDGRVQNIHHGLVRNPGGKAPFAAYGKPDGVKTGRFHAGPRFDLTEGGHEGVYTLHRGDTFFDVFGSYGLESSRAKAEAQALRSGKPLDDEPIRDVRQARQVLAVRGHDLYIVTDRILSGESHRITQYHTLYTPVRADRLADRLRLLAAGGVSPVTVDPATKMVRTHNPGLPNLEIRHFSAFPLEYRVKEDKRPASEAAMGGDLAALSKAFSKRDRHHMESAGAAMFSRQMSIEWNAKGEQTLVSVILPSGRAYAPEPGEALQNVSTLAPAPGVTGFSAQLPDGTALTYLAAYRPLEMAIGDLRATASSLLVVGDTGVIQDGRGLTVAGREVVLPAPDFTFRLAADGLVVEDVIHRPIRPVRIAPVVNVFEDTLPVTFACETPGVELRYTLDGSRPTPQSPLYSGPVLLRDTTRVKVRAFRPGVTEDVWTQDGTHASVVYSAVFRREAAREADPVATRPGLRTEYLEGGWTELMARSQTLPAKSTSVSRALADVSARRTDGAFAIRQHGFLEVPADGVYTFHAPDEFVYPDIESGYDLRLFVAGREWIPAVRWHGHGTWSVALKKGRHPFALTFVDFRHRPHKVELMWGFPHPDFTWKGTSPVVKISGPGLDARPIPAEWLSHAP